MGFMHMQRGVVALMVFGVLGCGQKKVESDVPAPAAQEVTEPKPSSAAEVTSDKNKVAEAAKEATAEKPEKAAVEVKISVTGAAMKFDVASITASVGQPVHVVLTNNKP